MRRTEPAPPGPRRGISVRAGTWDQVIFENVIRGEYGQLRFQGATVVDIGAHIGGFSVLAALGGARRVLAFEAWAANCGLLAKNCAGLGAVECRHAAVWRSDLPVVVLHWRESANRENTGGGTVLDCAAVAGAMLPGRDTHAVSAVAFDDVVAAAGVVDILKIDAEGSEYPILFTSRRLHQIREIVGEYHEVHGVRAGMQIPGFPDWNIGALAQHLARNGFDVRVSPKVGLGLFHAQRLAPGTK